MVRDQHDRGGPRRGGEAGQVRKQRLAGGEVQAGGRLVEQEEVGIRDERPGDRDPSPLPGRQRAERLVGRRGHPEAGQYVTRPLAVRVAVLVPPRLGRGVDRAHHQLDRRQAVTQFLLDGTPRRTDAAPQLARVDLPVAVAQDVDGPGRRPERQPDRGQERRLARPVGPEHDPPLALGDLPVERAEDRPARSPDLEAAHIDDHPRMLPARRDRAARRRRGGPAAAPPGRSAVPRRDPIRPATLASGEPWRSSRSAGGPNDR